jgi:hypothetical protein
MNKHRLNIQQNKRFPANRTAAWKKHAGRVSFVKIIEYRLLHQMQKDNVYMNNLFWFGETRRPQTGFLEEGC